MNLRTDVASPTEVQSLFRQARQEPNEVRQRTLVRQICGAITNKAYGSGQLALLVQGGLVDAAFSGEPTGILPLPPLYVLHWTYSEIDWTFLVEHRTLVPDARLVFIASVFSNAFRRRTSLGPLTGSHLNLLHLNSYLRVPLFSSARVRDTLAEVNHSYGFPATYVAEVLEDATGKLRLSDCSIDIIQDRRGKDLIYNRGYLFRIPVAEPIFYFDRRANIRLQNRFVERIARELHVDALLPAPDAVARHRDTLVGLLESRPDEAGLSEAFERYLATTRSLRYSLLGFCLFELLHEFLSEHMLSLAAVNRTLQELDPSNRTRWSMRGFSISSLEHLRSVMARLPSRPGEDQYERFLYFFWEELPWRIKAFRGTNPRYLTDCAFNAEFYGRLYPFDDSDRPTSLPSELARLEERIGEAMGSHLLRLMAAERVGAVCVPFQPDNRGEFLITPAITDLPGIRVDRVRVDLASEPYGVTVEEESIRARVTVSVPTAQSPEYPDALLPTSSTEHLTRYRAVLDSLRPGLSLRAGLLAQYQSRTPVAAVAVPFFKEHNSFVSAAVESARALQGRGYTPLVVLASNQPTSGPLNGAGRHYLESVGLVESALGQAGIGVPWRDYFLASIATERINGVSHWMIEKFLNVHTAATLLTELRALGVQLAFAAFIEGDVEHVELWWQRLPRNLDKVTVLEFTVGTRPEGSDDAPICDLQGSDAMYARLLAEPLTSLIIGEPIRHLFGGNFILGREPLHAFRTLLDQSNHRESLVESWLLDLEADWGLSTVDVGAKTHLPALKEYSFATDDKFIKWTMDLFDTIQRWRTKNATRSPSPGGSTLPPTRFRPETEPDAKARGMRACLNFGYCDAIYATVLPDSLRDQWHPVVSNVAAWCASTNPSPGPPVSQDLWTASLLHFFRAHADKAETIREEQLFALRVLFDLAACSRWQPQDVEIEPWTLGPVTRACL